MKAGYASRTAQFVAAARGLGSLLPPEDQIADDPYGVEFGGPIAQLIERAGTLAPRLMLSLPALARSICYMQVRTRALDDALAEFARAGGRQVVLLGAGFDCRAERFRALLDGGRVFEIDHPDTQARKRAILDGAGADQSRVVYLPWDFEKQATRDLPSALAAHGHDSSRKTLTIWEGVSMYLTPEAIESTIRSVRAYQAVGSPFAFNYFERKLIERPRFADRAMAVLVSGLGEPFRYGWDPVELPSWLEERGFRMRSDRSDKQLAAELLAPRWQRFVEHGGRHFAVAERF
jgi:methyltransferase (TIGR00027 family)